MVRSIRPIPTARVYVVCLLNTEATAQHEATFRFLLDREPKESILTRFDVTVIARYFPEFERELPRYLAQV